MPCSLRPGGTALVGAEPPTHDGAGPAPGVPVFSPRPTPGDALLIGLSNAVPSCAVTLRLGLHRGRRRRRSPASAAGLGGVDGCRLVAVRGRPRRDRWPPQQGRRRRPARARGTTRPRSSPGEGPGGYGAAWSSCSRTSRCNHASRVNAVTAFTIGRTAPMANAEVVHDRRWATPTVRQGSASPAPTQWSWPRRATRSRRRHPGDEQVGPRCATSPSPRPTTCTTGSTTSPGRSSSGRQCLGRRVAAFPWRGAAARCLAAALRSHRCGGGRRQATSPPDGPGPQDQRPHVARVRTGPRPRQAPDAETLGDAKVRRPMLLRARGRRDGGGLRAALRDVAPEALRCTARPAVRAMAERASWCSWSRTWRAVTSGPDPARRPGARGGHAPAHHRGAGLLPARRHPGPGGPAELLRL